MISLCAERVTHPVIYIHIIPVPCNLEYPGKSRPGIRSGCPDSKINKKFIKVNVLHISFVLVKCRSAAAERTLRPSDSACEKISK